MPRADIGDDEIAGIGSAFHVQPEEPANGRTAAVGRDHPVGDERVLAFGRVDVQGHAVRTLR